VDRRPTPAGLAAAVDPARARALCAGHFPGQPLVPGAQLVALMAELGAELAGPGARLAAVDRATFRRRVAPDAPIAVTVERAGAIIRASVRHAGHLAASAVLRYEPRP
jgi:3-hydroxymyristoyl/3-hydroxydecanoyl-(acyl carrier protein) dehydratase